MSDARVHVASEPGWDGHCEDGVEPTRIVQPCGRCGIVLSSFNTANPPSYSGPGPHEHAWWGTGKQVVRDPGYHDAGAFYLTELPDDELPDTPLCDHEEVPDDVDFYLENAEEAA